MIKTARADGSGLLGLVAFSTLWNDVPFTFGYSLDTETQKKFHVLQVIGNWTEKHPGPQEPGSHPPFRWVEAST